METLELLARYDSVLEEHLEKVRHKKEGSRLTQYLSPLRSVAKEC